MLTNGMNTIEIVSALFERGDIDSDKLAERLATTLKPESVRIFYKNLLFCEKQGKERAKRLIRAWNLNK